MAHKSQNPFLLRNFPGVNPEFIQKLEAVGFKKAEQMLLVGQTPKMRKNFASMVGIPESAMLELVKLSDLSLLPGVIGIRARLYYEAGANCVEKLTAYEPSDLLILTTEYVERTGFEGIPPLPKEVSSTIADARQLPRIIEW